MRKQITNKKQRSTPKLFLWISLKLSMKRFLFECLVAYNLHFEMKVINFYCDECFFIIKHSFVCDDPESGDPVFVSKLQNVCIG